MKKRVLSLVLVWCMAFTLLPTALAVDDTTPITNWLDSINAVTDTWDNGGIISTAQELAQFSYNVNHKKNYKGQTITLAADIDLSGKLWTPIGSKMADVTSKNDNDWEFMGSFDGAGHTISNLTIVDADYRYVGLFGVVSYQTDGFIKDLTLTDVNIQANLGLYPGANSFYKVSVGGLMGYLRGFENASPYSIEISGCSVQGSISAPNERATGSTDVGGLAGNMRGGYGRNNLTVENCTTDVDIRSSAFTTGGLIGFFEQYGIIRGCSATGNVAVNTSNENDASAGGFIGNATSNDDTALVENSYATGDVTVTTDGNYQFCAGGFVAYVSNGDTKPFEMKGCFSSGDVSLTGNGVLFAGGFGGAYNSYYEIEVSDSYCTGAVTATATADDSQVIAGGFVGSAQDWTATNCYAVGNVSSTGTALARAYGFCGNGNAGSAYVNCLALSEELHGSTAVNPFLTPKSNGTTTVTNCGYYDGIDFGDGTPGSTTAAARTLKALKAADTYVGFDDAVWTKVDGKPPILKEIPAEVQNTGKPAYLNAATYTVTYDGNGNDGGAVPVDDGIYLSGREVSVLPNSGALTRSGYDFAGWAKTVDAESADYTPAEMDAGTAKLSITEDTKLYAVWTRKSSGGSTTTTYRLTFQTNGGSAISSVSKAKNSVVELKQKPTKNGYIFDGWYRDAALTERITSVKLTAHTTVYAGWKLAEPEQPETEQFPFADVPENHWGRETVEWAYAQGLLTGLSETHFAPDESTTRAMMWVVLARADGQPTAPEPEWYESAQKWAIANGISDGTQPMDNITREQMVAILHRHAGSPSTAGMMLAEFSDADEVSSWAMDAMRWAVSEGVLEGKGSGRLDPKGNATRVELAAVLARYLALT